MVHDLMTEPILSWRDHQRNRKRTTLPGILAQLAAGTLEDFPKVRTHQFHPWVMFLTQLAILALHKRGETDPRLDEAGWRERLLALTEGAHEPWTLVVEDLSKPAFMQPPVPEGSVGEWSWIDHPDDRDVLVTAKQHDVKTGKVAGSDLEAWICALVSLQTMQGFPGRGYYGVSRMKGGYGNRPRVGVDPGHGLGNRFLRDVKVGLECWSGLVERGFSDGGVSLTWLVPWQGDTSLDLRALSPHYIEVCQRLRITPAPGGIVCRYSTSQTRRCIEAVENGDVGDLWTPIEREGGALTVGPSGFGYKLLSELLFGEGYAPAVAQQLRPEDVEAAQLVFWAMPRGQGKTEGLHERGIPMPLKVRKLLGEPQARARLGQRSTEAVQDAVKMRQKVLYPAMKCLGLAPADEFDDRVDEIFFAALYEGLDLSSDEARLSWARRLRDLARAELEVAIQRAPLGEARHYKAISSAEGMFRGCLNKNFPDLEEVNANG